MTILTKENLKEELRQRIRESYAVELEDASSYELFFTLGSLVKAIYNDNWRETWKNYLKEEQKQAYYFSIEFLPGKMLKSNLLNLGLLDLVRETLSDLDVDLDDLADVENVPFIVTIDGAGTGNDYQGVALDMEFEVQAVQAANVDPNAVPFETVVPET